MTRRSFRTQEIAILCWCPRGSQNIDSKNVILCFCNRYLYHISKNALCFVNRYWSHISDFEAFIKRIFGICRCPSFQILIKLWKSRFTTTICFKMCPLVFLHFLEYFWIYKSMNKGPPGAKSPEIMEMLGSGPSHNKTEICLDQN